MRLKQVASIGAGYPFRGRIHEKAGAVVRAVQMKDVSPQGGIYWPECVQTELTGRREPDWLTPGDILFIARGSHNYAVMVQEEVRQTGIKAVAAPHFFVLKTRRGEVLPEYLVWLLNQNVCQRYFDQNAEGTLTKSIRRTVLEELPIVVPALEQQQAIIALANTVWQERQVAGRLVRNGEQLMNAIADDLMNSNGAKP